MCKRLLQILQPGGRMSKVDDEYWGGHLFMSKLLPTPLWNHPSDSKLLPPFRDHEALVPFSVCYHLIILCYLAAPLAPSAPWARALPPHSLSTSPPLLVSLAPPFSPPFLSSLLPLPSLVSSSSPLSLPLSLLLPPLPPLPLCLSQLPLPLSLQ